MPRRRALAIGSLTLVVACFADERTNGDGEEEGTASATAAESGTSGTTTASTGVPTSSSTSVTTTDPPSSTSDAPTAWRQRIDIDTANLGERMGGVPVLLRLLPDRVDYEAMEPDGSDLRVYDDNDALLPFEVERWDPEAESLLWVRIADLRPDEPAEIQLGYGEAASPAPDPSSVWVSGYVGVWHFAGSLEDSTAHGFDFAMPAAPPTEAEGMIGSALRFEVSSDFIDVADDDLLDVTEGLTIEVWAMPTEVAKGDNAYVERKGQSYQLIAVQQGTGAPAFVVRQSDGMDVRVDGMPALQPTEWTWLVGTVGTPEDTALARLFVDGGAPFEDQVVLPLAANNSPLRLGGAPWLGAIDEVRLSDEARTEAWIAFQYRSMTDQVLTFHEPEPH